MNKARFDSLYAGLNGQVQRVYQATPISEAWAIDQIYREMSRLGFNQDTNILGCLNRLKNIGLVREPKPRLFIRAEVKPEKVRAVRTEPQTNEHDKEDAPMAAPTTLSLNKAAEPAKAINPLDAMARLASRATQLAGAIKELAADIEDVALEVTERMADSEEKAKKLRQLQELLGSLK